MDYHKQLVIAVLIALVQKMFVYLCLIKVVYSGYSGNSIHFYWRYGQSL